MICLYMLSMKQIAVYSVPTPDAGKTDDRFTPTFLRLSHLKIWEKLSVRADELQKL